ncbi:MAG TPA: dTDP-glucose 4,6-dehydratase [Candidatus Saccharimonadales bacterium]|nr:dTDP-glucose 4,6-dehydratase [Candidatus Saccharimonadales bacterium]
MKVLITGGAGFIGSNFVHYIAKHRPSWQITVFDNLTYAGNLSNLIGLGKSKYTFIKGDICDEESINNAVGSNDLVVHFAAESHVDNSINSPWPFANTNLIGTYWVLEAVRKNKKRLHHISTDEVFGDLRPNDPKFSENSPYKPSSPYSATKAGSDHLVRAWTKSFNITATISNCSNNYGPRQHPEKLIPRHVTEIIEGREPKLYGEGTNIRDWIHVDDHNSAVLAIIEKGKNGETYLIGNNQEQTNKQVLDAILDIMGNDANYFEFVEDRPGHDRRYAIDSSKIKEELDWEPKYKNFRDGLVDTINWYKDNEQWWKPQKANTEEKYKKLGR